MTSNSDIRDWMDINSLLRVSRSFDTEPKDVSWFFLSVSYDSVRSYATPEPRIASQMLYQRHADPGNGVDQRPVAPLVA